MIIQITNPAHISHLMATPDAPREILLAAGLTLCGGNGLLHNGAGDEHPLATGEGHIVAYAGPDNVDPTPRALCPTCHMELETLRAKDKQNHLRDWVTRPESAATLTHLYQV